MEQEPGSTEGGTAEERGRPDPYRELFERSADAILIIEGETFVDCNEATVRMLRYRDRAELLKTHPSELSPPVQPDGRDSFAKANEMIAIAFERGSHRFEWDHKRADGEVFPVEVLLTAVQEGGRHVLHVVWRDITDRRRLEQELRQAQRLETIGKLAGGIAHDFNNLLVAILGHSELLAMALEREPRQLMHAREIQKAGDRAAKLVRQLLAFSRKQEFQPKVFDANGVLLDLDALLRRLLGEDVRLVTQPASTGVMIKADPGQVEQVILNLATNARDAMPDGGVLTIEVAPAHVDAGVGGVVGLEPGWYGMIAVSDTGVGMDAETVLRACEPFFTTKPQGEGTGLGLATVHGITTRSGGTVAIHSTLGRGTTVKAYFPISGEPPTPTERPPTAHPDSGGHETILVAEDDAAVARLVVELLERRGYKVVLARNGREALSAWDRLAGRVDLVLTDVVMPALGGPELVEELRRAGHAPRVLFMSGYTNNALATLSTLGGAVDLLEKPFSAAQLVGRVRGALDRVG
jgi:PAS domain S-box-containing protein